MMRQYYLWKIYTSQIVSLDELIILHKLFYQFQQCKGTVADPGGGGSENAPPPPLFPANTWKTKFAEIYKKILGSSPQNPGRPPLFLILDPPLE